METKDLSTLTDLPIHAGKADWQGYMGICTVMDQTLGNFRAPELTSLLTQLFPEKTKTTLNRWRIDYCKTHGKGSPVWDMVRDCAQHTLPKRKARRLKPAPKLTDDHKPFQDLLAVYKRKLEHSAELEDFAPESEDIKGGAVTCIVCYDSFKLSKVVTCDNFEDIHHVCKPCFNRYCLETLPSITLTTIPCPQCKTYYSKSLVTAALSEWDVMMLEEKDTRRNCQVALNKDILAVIYCDCGVVAVVEEQDKGSGVVLCLCGKNYCCQCGNFEHPGRVCPPPPNTVQWLDKHSKKCPNCGHAIEKKGGCNHMTCSTKAMGCGHEFCWLCSSTWGTCRCKIFS